MHAEQAGEEQHGGAPKAEEPMAKHEQLQQQPQFSIAEIEKQFKMAELKLLLAQCQALNDRVEQDLPELLTGEVCPLCEEPGQVDLECSCCKRFFHTSCFKEKQVIKELIVRRVQAAEESPQGSQENLPPKSGIKMELKVQYALCQLCIVRQYICVVCRQPGSYDEGFRKCTADGCNSVMHEQCAQTEGECPLHTCNSC